MTDDPKRALARKLGDLDDATVWHRMVSLGFWSDLEPIPVDPQGERDERERLERESAALRKKALAVGDPEKALAEERKRRWKASIAKRAIRKAERDADRRARAAAWEAARKERVAYAGIDVSAGLAADGCDEAALVARGLPVIGGARALADALGIELKTLRWLTFHRRGATLVHYHRFTIPKKSGGIRGISAPKRALARAQRWILRHVLERLEVTESAHGFVEERSIVTNARPHVGRRVVVNLDLESFFPSVTFRRVKGLYRKLGYGEQVATLLALFCTEPPRVSAELDGKRMYVALGDRVLPQGACTSPAITNAICRRLDRRLDGLARRFGFAFTRYADDLTFSGDDGDVVGRLLGRVRAILRDEGFTEHPRKTRVMRAARRQEVTGVVVNERVSLPREERRELRAILHNAARHGLASQNREGVPFFADRLRGRVAYAVMVDPSLRATLIPALRAALTRA